MDTLFLPMYVATMLQGAESRLTASVGDRQHILPICAYQPGGVPRA
jgi:hypothetical protein